jgi:hypothetical protein
MMEHGHRKSLFQYSCYLFPDFSNITEVGLSTSLKLVSNITEAGLVTVYRGRGRACRKRSGAASDLVSPPWSLEPLRLLIFDFVEATKQRGVRLDSYGADAGDAPDRSGQLRTKGRPL